MNQVQEDLKYLTMAELESKSSYAIRRKVGAIIVKDRQIISEGYNGTPSGLSNNCEDLIGGKLVTKPIVLHAESNAITKIAKSTLSSEGATMYCTCSPCLECAKLIIQSGISRLVYKDLYHTDEGIKLLKEAGIEVESYDDIKNKNKTYYTTSAQIREILDRSIPKEDWYEIIEKSANNIVVITTNTQVSDLLKDLNNVRVNCIKLW